LRRTKENSIFIFGIAEGDNKSYTYLLDKEANLVIIHFHSLYLKKVLGNSTSVCRQASNLTSAFLFAHQS